MRKLIHYIYVCVSVVVAAVLMSCSDAEEEYSTKYPCVFTFYTQSHPTSLLTLALDNPGTYVNVKVELVKGAHRLDISSGNGHDRETVLITTDRENYQIGNVGADNCIIVGCSTFDGLRAYDGQCPNCLIDYSGNRFPLVWADNGQAVTCGKCGRRYELNYDGRTDDGRALLRYHVAYDGAVLVVRN